MAHPRVLLQPAARPSHPLSVLYRSGSLRQQFRSAHIKGAPSRSPSQPKPKRNSSVQQPEQAVLEKPDRYRKPSHPARLPRRSSFNGPPLSEDEIQAQKTKQYPHMMPPEGTTMHWFLTNRRIHLIITFGILGSLGSFVWIENFRSSLSPDHKLLLPSKSLLPFHPFEFIGGFYEVYKLHVARISQEVEEKRQQDLADAQKRARYRKAHGIEVQGIPAMLGFKPETKDGQPVYVGPNLEGPLGPRPRSPEEIEGIQAANRRAPRESVTASPVAAEHSVEQGQEDEAIRQESEGKVSKRRKWAPFGISLW